MVPTHCNPTNSVKRPKNQKYRIQTRNFRNSSGASSEIQTQKLKAPHSRIEFPKLYFQVFMPGFQELFENPTGFQNFFGASSEIQTFRLRNSEIPNFRVGIRNFRTSESGPLYLICFGATKFGTGARRLFVHWDPNILCNILFTISTRRKTLFFEIY